MTYNEINITLVTLLTKLQYYIRYGKKKPKTFINKTTFTLKTKENVLQNTIFLNYLRHFIASNIYNCIACSNII